MQISSTLKLLMLLAYIIYQYLIRQRSRRSTVSYTTRMCIDRLFCTKIPRSSLCVSRLITLWCLKLHNYDICGIHCFLEVTATRASTVFTAEKCRFADHDRTADVTRTSLLAAEARLSSYGMTMDSKPYYA